MSGLLGDIHDFVILVIMGGGIRCLRARKRKHALQDSTICVKQVVLKQWCSGKHQKNTYLQRREVDPKHDHIIDASLQLFFDAVSFEILYIDREQVCCLNT